MREDNRAPEEEKGILTYYDEDSEEIIRKDGLIVMSFGSTYSEARKLSIDAAMEDIRAAFLELRVELAVSSAVVRRRIKKQSGEEFLSIEEAVDKLHKEGCTRLIMQPLAILPDDVYEGDRDVYYIVRERFCRTVLGVPLIYWTGGRGTHDDLQELFLTLQRNLPAMREDEAIVIVGHGSYHWTNDYFYILEDKIAELGYTNCFVAALKGTPTIDDTILKLWRAEVKNVLVVPLMMTGGYHVTCDMNGDKPESIRRRLEVSGFDVRVDLHGIAENPEIRELFIKRIKMAKEKLDA